MATGDLIAYPEGLPAPQSAPLLPTERRLVSEIKGPLQVRGIQRDFHAIQRLAWVLTAEQGRRFDDWWRDTLLRGGMWFAADWPLPSGRVGNVYRFHTTPRWEYLRGGPKGWGMHRVSAEVEVRGRGDLPRNRFIVSVTSTPYPVVAEDALDIGFPGADAGFINMPSDHLGLGFSLDGGELRTLYITYATEPDEIDIGFSLDGGSLRTPLITYEGDPELLDITFTLENGSLRVALIRYTNWQPEEIDIGFSLDGGSLS